MADFAKTRRRVVIPGIPRLASLRGLASLAGSHIREGKLKKADETIQVAIDKAIEEGNHKAEARLKEALAALRREDTETARKLVELVATGVWIG